VLIAQRVIINVASDHSFRFDQAFARIHDEAAIETPADKRRVAERVPSQSPLEKTLNDQIDQMRDQIVAGDAPTALRLLQALLKGLPGSTTAKIVYRIKSNIGYGHLQLGDDAEAARWFEDAYAAAPNEPKAIANKAVALIISDQPKAAFEFAKDALAIDPENEFVASQLLGAAAQIPDEEDPLGLIPLALREREEVVVARTAYLRQRESRPDWWRYARNAAKRFPNNDRLKLLCAEAALDEATSSGAFQAPTTEVDSELLGKLTDAATFFEEKWSGIERSATPNRPEAIQILSSTMVAYLLLGQRDRSLRFAELLVDRTSDKDILYNVALVARAAQKDEAALHALDRIGESTRGDFIRGMIHLDRNDWSLASKFFTRSEIPPSEVKVISTVIALAPLQTGTKSVDGTTFDSARAIAEGDPRALVVLARVAAMRGATDVGDHAFMSAKAALSLSSTLSERSMVAALAADRGDEHSVIDVLDGYLPENIPSRDLLLLAESHANERPKRERNVGFFKRLRRDIRQRPEIARCRATVLLDAGETRDAERIFRSLVKQRPNDVYVILRHIDALRRLNRESESTAAVLAVDENSLAGPAEYLMAFAHALRQAGNAERSWAFAFEVVRRNADNPKVSLGYVSLVLSDKERSVPEPAVAEPGSWVRLTKNGEADAFVIEQGAAFLGIECVSPQLERAKRVLGMSVGQTLQVDKGMFPSETWTLVEVKNKFIHLLHVIMNEFEKRYPGANGLWRVDVGEKDIQPLLDVVRKKAEADRDVATNYIEKGLPLSFVARMLGGEPAGFAQFIRSLDADIVACVGTDAERQDAYKLAEEARGNGVVLDEYTAWVAAEIDALVILKLWFGRLVVSTSTIASIDKLISRENEGLGRNSMNVAWRDGHFYRTESTDENIHRQVSALQKLKEDILAQCDVERPLIPNDLPEFALRIVEDFGSRLLDPVLLAKTQKTALLSDDLRYRQVAELVNGTKGLWLQAVLASAHSAGLIDLRTATAKYAQLAARRHSHINLDAEILREAFDSDTDNSLAEFDILTNFIGSKTADMPSHLSVTVKFLNKLWDERKGDLKCQKATSIVTERLIRFRKTDWGVWFSGLLFGSAPLANYLFSWSTGHFMPEGPIMDGYELWENHLARLRRVRRFRRDASRFRF
jgi:tetratricopeptide (TPR) repeat protein